MGSRKLSNYRAKRDFTRTAEPSGTVGVAPGEHLRFVIQKHAARRLHFDLRLELDGVFKSWAVTRGPSVDPAEKRLAVEVEDHPLAYGDFEGTIPGGQYGGGTVQLWDRGFWAPEGNQSAEEALAAGDLKFVLAGERLQGSWVLVRMKGDRFRGNRTNWLLIKHRDQYAHPGDNDALLAEDRSVASGRPMAQIAAGKGGAPVPFMMAQGAGTAKADAVWNSNRGDVAGAARAAPPAAEPLRASGANHQAGGTGRPAASGAGQPGKAVRAAMPGFIEPQLAQLAARPPSAAGWGHEIKLDGYRLQLRVANGRVTLKTRKGLDWTEKFASLAAAARNLPDCILDGEAIALSPQGSPDFSALQAALSEGRSDAIVLFTFDLLFAQGQDLRGLPLEERKRRLEALLDAQPQEATAHIRYLGHLEASGDAILESARSASLEGIVSKRLDAPYTSGRRAGSWVKAKWRPGHEVVIGGWTSEGQQLRSLIVGVYKDGHLMPVGRVGTGFNSENIKSLVTRLKKVASDKSPFKERVPVPAGRVVHWVKPDLVAEIEFAGWTDGGNIRQAAFKALREDKPATEVHAETLVAARTAVLAQPDTSERGAEGGMSTGKRTNTNTRDVGQAATGFPKARPGDKASREAAGRAMAGKVPAGVPNTVLGVTISKPDKVFWPNAGDDRPVTKVELARYFEAVGDWLLPHIEGRPCSILRAPDGIEGETFFQRHAMAGMSSLLDLARVAGDREPYVVINRAAGLAAVAQSGGIELHPSNCEPGHPDIPGRLVFDLDPAPDVDFGAVIAAAHEMRSRLEAIGLESFCKTTGGKGLHVVTPLAHPRNTHLDWTVVKAFAREVCRQMAADKPDRYLINMSKSARKGLIYLDYLRNDRLSTAVAPLSPRARAGATVSMPLTWDQVRAGLDPSRFTIRTAPGLLARGKAWRGYETAARPIVKAVELLARGQLAANAKKTAVKKTTKGASRARGRRQSQSVRF